MHILFCAYMFTKPKLPNFTVYLILILIPFPFKFSVSCLNKPFSSVISASPAWMKLNFQGFTLV